MANANAPTGLRPVNELGGEWMGAGTLVAFPASQTTNIFVGDPLVPLGGTDANGVPLVGIATAGAGNNVLGAFLGVANGPAGSGSTLTRDLAVYRAASVLNYGYACITPHQLYMIQEDSVGGAIAAATAGFANGNMVSGAGNTTYGTSGWQLQSSSVSASANTNYQLRIIGLLRSPDNVVGNYADWLVRLNTSSIASTSGV